MDDLSFLRDLADTPPPPTEKSRLAARNRLLKAAAEEGGSPGLLSVLFRRTVFRVAVATSVAAGVGIAVVTSTGGGAARSPQLSLSAAEVLNKAASRALAGGPGSVPEGDQYLYTKTYTAHTPLNGGKARTWTDESWMSVDGSKPSRREELGKVHNDPPLKKDESLSFPNAYSELLKWPTDPDELFRRFGGGDNSRIFDARMGDSHAVLVPPGSKRYKLESDMDVYNQASYFMKGRVVPPALKAATFKVLAKLPEVRIDPHGVDALGRHGIAVSFPHVASSFVFDARTFDYLGLSATGYETKTLHGKQQVVPVYREVDAQQEIGVVDRIGQRP